MSMYTLHNNRQQSNNGIKTVNKVFLSVCREELISQLAKNVMKQAGNKLELKK